MTLKELLDHLGITSLISDIGILELEVVLREEAIDPKDTRLQDLDFRNVDHETKTIQLIKV